MGREWSTTILLIGLVYQISPPGKDGQLLENNVRGATTRPVFRKGPARSPYLGVDHSMDEERGAFSFSPARVTSPLLVSSVHH